ncbi:hypothetical protein [Streptomyces sp. NPDC088752]|uniref:hypothetical protein n=1 Tax=Streptomyces sp. NPDC088752 TaxID=3154963 RepID=UPI00343EF908
MFVMLMPEGFVPEEHGWEKAIPLAPESPVGDLVGDVFLRWAPPVRFPASLAMMPDPVMPVVRMLYGPLVTAGHGEQAAGRVLLEEIGAVVVEPVTR